jgi:hypothetical protein
MSPRTLSQRADHEPTLAETGGRSPPHFYGATCIPHQGSADCLKSSVPIDLTEVFP